jgi:hypothetical protein
MLMHVREHDSSLEDGCISHRLPEKCIKRGNKEVHCLLVQKQLKKILYSPGSLLFCDAHVQAWSLPAEHLHELPVVDVAAV